MEDKIVVTMYDNVQEGTAYQWVITIPRRFILNIDFVHTMEIFSQRDVAAWLRALAYVIESTTTERKNG